MSKDKNHIGHTLTPELIEKYINGELSHQEMNAVEKLMLDSDFDAEAMEGFEITGTDHIDHDLKVLGKNLKERVHPTQRSGFFWFKIAASLLLLAISVVFIINLDLNNNTLKKDIAESAAEESTTTEQPEDAKDEDFSSDSLIALNKKPEEDAERQLLPPVAQSGAVETDPVEQEEISESKVEVAREATVEAVEPITLAEAEEEQIDVAADIETAAEEFVVPELEDTAKEDPAAKIAGVQATEQAADRIERARKKMELRSRAAAAVEAMDLPQKLITGKITSMEDGSALPGVNVVVKGTTIGTVTDIDGQYQISVPVNIDPTLVVSFIGLNSEEVKVGDKSKIDVQLTNNVTQLSEVVVTGYGAGEDDSSSDYVVRAKPEGGNTSFKRYVEDNLRYPSDSSGIKGKVVVEFEVLANGKLDNFNIIRSLGDAFDQEAIRVIKEGPGWKPTTRNGIPEKDTVRVRVKF